MVNTVAECPWSSYPSYLGIGEFDKLVETETVLELFSKNQKIAKRLFEQYMNDNSEEHFLDLVETEKMNVEAAGQLFSQLLQQQGD